MTMGMLIISRFLALSHAAAETFVAGLWEGLLLVAAAALSLRLLPRMTASARFAVWALTFLLSLALPLLRLPFHSAPAPVALPVPSAPLHLSQAWSSAIIAFWVALALTRTSQLLAQVLHLRRLWLRAVPVMAQGSGSRRFCAGRRTAELCTSTDVESPGVIGFFSPRLLIPASMFPQLGEQELNQIALHECAHLKRGDDWSNLLQKIALLLFPLNPAAFWLDRRLGLERELACDAAVVRSTAAPTTYARCLARLAEHRLRARGFALALSARGRQSELGRRIEVLLSPAHPSSSLQAAASFSILAAVLTVSSLAVVHAPQLISFTQTAPTLQAQASVAPRLSHAMAEIPQSPRVIAAQPVAFRRRSQPKPALASAVFSPSRAPGSTAAYSPGLRRFSATRVRTVSAVETAARPRMVLAGETGRRKSSGHPAPSAAVPAVYTVPYDLSSSYAAVPFGDGWLIIQL